MWNNCLDVVLLDFKMLGMDGMEAPKEIRKIASDIDVVIISAYGTIERAFEAMGAGAFYYIIKPVDLDRLLILLDRILQIKLEGEKKVA